MRCRAFAWVSLALAVSPLHAVAQDPGDRSFTALSSGGRGSGASIGSAGNVRVSLPLNLPAPRGALPLPFSVDFDGSSTVGAAGVGWDIPIFGVSRQRNLSRRKPVHRLTSAAEPVTADRVFVDIGAGAMLMAPTSTPDVFQPFGNGFYELRFTAGVFVGRDGGGRRWVFEPIPALLDDDFFALVRIEDASGINRVELDYQVFDRELLLNELRYSHDEHGACPKYRLQLHYSTSPSVLGFEFVRGRPRTRSHLLQRIELVTASDTSCAAATIRSEQMYRITYQPDPVTGAPRLTSVDMLGPPVGVTPGDPLPVVTYRYGSSISNGAINYAEAEHILLPAGPNGGNRGFGVTAGKGGGTINGHIRGFQDMNGDGRADFVSLNSAGNAPVLAINRPSGLGNDFSTLPATVSLPNTPVAPYNLGTPDLSFGLPVVASIDNTYQQVIDFNGDGRPDIVVATEGRNAAGDRDPAFWKVFINQPGPSGQRHDIVWLDRNIDISAVRAEIMQHHRLSPVSGSDQNSKPLPIERTHQTGAFENNIVIESSVLTQWRLLDVNADGFPDFVFDSAPLTARTESRCDAAGKCRNVTVQDHGEGARLMVIYHTGPMMAGSGAQTQNVWRGPAVMLREDGACGVTRMTFLGGGKRQLQCGFLEASGDGIVDYIVTDTAGARVIRSSGLAQAHDAVMPGAIPLPGAVGVLRDPRATACTSGAPGTKTYDIEQISDVRDITGDGIPDYVFFGGPRNPPGHPDGPQRWWFMAGTGTGFVAAREIRSPAGVPFALHVSQERCDGRFSNLITALTDLDGDGRPEIVHSPNVMNVRVAKLTNLQGELGAHSAGQIVSVDNGYGSITRMRYGSAKSDSRGRQDVPYPQIVVTESEQVAAFNIGTSIAPVRYAYGAPQQVYHPLLGRFVFAGYRRRIEIHGEAMASQDQVKGSAIVTTAIDASTLTNVRDKLMLAGQPREVRVLAGAAPADPRRLLGSLSSVPLAHVSQMMWKTQALPGVVSPLPPLDDECYATPVPQTPGQFGDLTLCRRAATAFIAESTTTEGPELFPLLGNVATRSRVQQVDPFGRPTRSVLEGDRRRTDDDVCVDTEYAAPVSGAALILDAPSVIRVHACGNASQILSVTRMHYDDLPLGQVGIGRASARRLERRNTTTGELIEAVPSATIGRDVYGNPIELTRTRSDGKTSTARATYDPFGLMPLRSETTATGLAAPLITQTVRHPHALLPLTVTTTTGAMIHNRYDNHGRLVRIALTRPGDPVTYVIADMALNGFNGAPSGRSVRQRIFHTLVPETQVTTPPADSFTAYTAVLDEFARLLHIAIELGPDYGNQSVIVESTTYDTLGRVRFIADPFPASVFGPRHGMTLTYRPDGRPECLIEGTGIQTDGTTDESGGRYPTCTTYRYRNGQLQVRRKGPNELAFGKPQSAAFDQDVYSAQGLLLSRSRVQGSTTLELATYGYDRLGNLASLRRFANPDLSSIEARWTWVNDSFGDVIEMREPAGLRQRFTYDDWGNLTAVRWKDSTGIAALERAMHFEYDGLGRPTRMFESQNGETRQGTLSEYFYDQASGQPQHLDAAFLNGRLSFARTGSRTVFYGYDSLGRLTTITNSEGGAEFTQRLVHGAAGQPEALELFTPGSTAPAVHVRYSYDSALRPRAVELQEGSSVTELWRALQTDIFGRVLRARRGNGAVEELTYRDDARRELLRKRSEVNGAVRELHFNGYDGAMLPAGTVELPGFTPGPPINTTYTYDARNALARAVVKTGDAVTSDLAYAYDGLGNLTGITDAIGAGSLRIRPDPVDPDRVCSVSAPAAPVGPCTYRYDALGNVRSQQSAGSLLTYDGASRIRSLHAGTRNASMTYDPFGGLSSLRASDSQTERRATFLGPSSRVAFFDASGDPIDVGPPPARLHSYTDLAIDSPVGMVAALRRSNTGLSAVLYPLGEAQGTRNVLDGSGAVTQAIDYDPYGNILADNGSAASLTYFPYQWNGGHVLDGFGLTAVGERVLDSRTGRFLQRDPVINSATSGTAHPYSFAWNNPAAFVDRTGAEPEPAADSGGGGVLAALGRFIDNNAFQGSDTVDPRLEVEWACDYDHNCMRALEEAGVELTDFETKLQAQFHTSRDSIKPAERYRVIVDRGSGVVLGYAFLNNNLEIYDRSEKPVAFINSERPLEGVILSPIDFLSGGIASVGRRIVVGHGTRRGAAAAEGRLASSGSGVSTKNLPLYNIGTEAMFPKAANAVDEVIGRTLPNGTIFLNPRLHTGTAPFNLAWRHESMHHWLSARSGLFVSARQRASVWFFKRSHFLKYTEEALAEGFAHKSIWTGLKYPFLHPYGLKPWRVFVEAEIYFGGLYYTYKLGRFLGSDFDK